MMAHQALGIGSDEIDHVTEGRDLPRAVKDVVLDQGVHLPLVEVGLELGAGSELVQVEQHQVRIESWFAIWRRSAKLGLGIQSLPAAECLELKK